MKRGTVTVGYLHPGQYAACFAESLLDLMFCDATGEQRIVSHPFGKMGKQAGSAGISTGRNKLAQAFLDEADSEWFFSVDADMGFAGDTVERLIGYADRYRRPVVGGLCFAIKQDGRSSFYGQRYRVAPTVYDFHETDDAVGFAPRLDYDRGTITEVSATGAACLLVHRSAFEKVRDRYGDVWFDPITHPTGPTTFSEDLSFCVRLAACDIPIFVHTGVKTTHDKGALFLDEELFDLQQASRAALAVTA